MKIFIAAGHGGTDPGAVSGDAKERDEVEKIVNKTVIDLTQILKNKAEIIQVPNALNVNDTAKWINEKNQGQNGNICIEVHLNSNEGMPGTGIETYYGDQNLANLIHNKLVLILGLKNRGVKVGDYLAFNKNTIPASCLVELGFINNPADLKMIREQGSHALTEAIHGVFAIYDVNVEAPPSSEKKLLFEIKELIQKEIQGLENIYGKIN